MTTSFGGDTEARALAIQPDGRIVAVGYTYSPFGGFFALARYNSDGSLDATFDGDGEVTTDFGGVFSQASGVALQADGRIVVAGSGGATNDVALARYNADGSLDSTFDGDGRLTTDLGGYDRAEGLAIQTDGKIVVAGQGGLFTVFALLRYNSDGSLDASFDGEGRSQRRSLARTSKGPRPSPSKSTEGSWSQVRLSSTTHGCSPWPATTPTAASTRISARAAR